MSKKKITKATDLKNKLVAKQPDITNVITVIPQQTKEENKVEMDENGLISKQLADYLNKQGNKGLFNV